MKNSIKLFGFASFLFIFSSAFSQNPEDFKEKFIEYSQNSNTCKIIGDIEGVYKGKCKKGLAHGKGVFKYAEVAHTYEGSFKDGMMNGKGIVFVMVNGKKEVINRGVWKDNVFLGAEEKPLYEISQRLFVDDLKISKYFDVGDKVYFKFFQNGGTNPITNLEMAANSGDEMIGHNVAGFKNITFPFVVFISYTTYNKFRSAKYTARIKVTINEPGVWEVKLIN